MTFSVFRLYCQYGGTFRLW